MKTHLGCIWEAIRIVSNRLQCIADFIEKGKIVADIGTDHAYLPIELIRSRHVNKVYAMDINVGPLDKAKVNVKEACINGEIIFIQSNGLNNLQSDVETVIIAGMGGILIAKILEEGKNKLTYIDDFIVSPHSDNQVVRLKIHKMGFMIKEEVMIKEQGKYYTIMHCIHGQEIYTPLEYHYGKVLIQEKRDVFMEYIQYRKAGWLQVKTQLLENKTESSKKRIIEIELELEEIREVERV